ncbi:MAG: hypothetical protein PHR21_04290 [Oscillospiraceae bacterium]|nr:hypothetical protein [Oscillospiraceae bacterium]MDD4368268.1 hypothetical protein [Oscillospiraceae bacterium]
MAAFVFAAAAKPLSLPLGAAALLFMPLLLIAWIVLIGGSLLFYFLRGRLLTRLEQTLLGLTEQVTGLEGRSMDNREAVREAFAQCNWELLKERFYRWDEDSQALYQGRWFSPLLNDAVRQALLTAADRRLLGADIPLTLLLLAFLFSLVLTLLPGTETSLLTPWLPTFFAVIAALFLSWQGQEGNQRLEQALGQLRQALARRLPVFSSDSSSALLVEECKRYDRDMAGEISRLQASVQALADHQLSQAVAASVREVMRQDVVPDLADSSRKLSDAAANLAKQQYEGISQVTADFSAQLANQLRHSLEPLYRDSQQLTAALTESQQLLQQASQQLDQGREQSLLLQQQAAGTLEQARQAAEQFAQASRQALSSWQNLTEQSRKVWQEDARAQHAMWLEEDERNKAFWQASAGTWQETLRQFAQSAQQLQTSQSAWAGDQQVQAQQLAAGLEQFRADLNQTAAALRELQEKTARYLNNSGEVQTRLLQDYQTLSQNMTVAAAQLQDNSARLARVVHQLNDRLEHSVSTFSGQLQDGVAGSLKELDQALAEISLRISANVREVQDAMNQAADTLDNSGNRQPAGLAQAVPPQPDFAPEAGGSRT